MAGPSRDCSVTVPVCSRCPTSVCERERVCVQGWEIHDLDKMLTKCSHNYLRAPPPVMSMSVLCDGVENKDVGGHDMSNQLLLSNKICYVTGKTLSFIKVFFCFYFFMTGFFVCPFPPHTRTICPLMWYKNVNMLCPTASENDMTSEGWA